LAVLASVLSVAASRAANHDAWTTYRSDVPRFSIALPSSWRTVPRSDAALRTLIRRLRSQGKLDLAQQYGRILSDPYQRGGQFAFQAFPWPADDYPITTDMTVRLARVPQVLGKDGKVLREMTVGLADELRKEVRKGGGTLGSVRRTRIPAGPAYAFDGTTPLDPSYGGAESAFGVVVTGSGHTVYMLQFRADSRAYAARAATFARIAATISFR
jgi:hypothetical protein